MLDFMSLGILNEFITVLNLTLLFLKNHYILNIIEKRYLKQEKDQEGQEVFSFFHMTIGLLLKQ